MSDPVKVLSTEIALSNTAANTVSNASLVRIVNNDASNSVVITVANSSVTHGTFTLGASGTNFSSIDLIKAPADTVVFTGTSPNIKATSIGYY